MVIMDIVELHPFSFTRYQRVLTSQHLIREVDVSWTNEGIEIRSVTIPPQERLFKVTSVFGQNGKPLYNFEKL